MKIVSEQPRMSVWSRSMTKLRPLRSRWIGLSSSVAMTPISALKMKIPLRRSITTMNFQLPVSRAIVPASIECSSVLTAAGSRPAACRCPLRGEVEDQRDDAKHEDQPERRDAQSPDERGRATRRRVVEGVAKSLSECRLP